MNNVNRNNLWDFDYFTEAGEEVSANQAPTSDPTTGSGIPGVGGSERGDSSPATVGGNPQNKNQDKVPGLGDMKGPEDQQPQDDIENDPEHPDMPEQKETRDFESWRGEFIQMSLKMNAKEMLDSIRPWKDKCNDLEPSQAKFVNDNYTIFNYLQDPQIEQGMKEVRNLIRQQVDRTYPGTVIMQHLTTVIDKHEPLQQILIKLFAAYGLKIELHRKFLAALLFAVQTGGGNRRMDLVYAERKLTVNIDTRFATDFGEINIGRWALKTSDPDEILSDTEMDQLKDGSPDMRAALRRRVILESFAKQFMKRSLLIHINHPEGGTHAIGWDLGESLQAGYHDGRVMVRSRQSDTKNAMISESGDVVPLLDTDFMYVQETGETDDSGNPEAVEVPFISVRDNTAYLVADKKTLENAGAVLNGLFMKEIPFNGNPSDLKGIRDSLPNLKGMLNKDY